MILSLGLCAAVPSFAAVQGRPWAVSQLEQEFAGRFILTTADGEDYDVYERVDDPEGLPENGDIVCMQHDCYLRVAHAPPGSLTGYGERHGSLGPLRKRFTMVRDAYDLMRAAPPDGRPAAIQEWRTAIGGLSECLEKVDQCQ